MPFLNVYIGVYVRTWIKWCHIIAWILLLYVGFVIGKLFVTVYGIKIVGGVVK